MKPLPVAVACVAGALVGALYTLSPMLVWFGVAMVPLFAWVGRGLGGRERTWVFALLGSAVALRLFALVIFYFVTRPVDGAFVGLMTLPDDSFPVLIPDEWYLAHKARMLRYAALGIPLGGQEAAAISSPYGDASLFYVRAYLQLLLGEAPYTIRLFDTALYLAACVTLYRAVRPTFGALAALGGLAVVLFLPSLFIWSIASLKETPALFLTASSVGAALTAVRSRSLPVGVLAFAVVGVAVLSLASVRPGTDVIVGGGVMAGLMGTLLIRLIRRPVLLSLTLVLCIAGGAAALQRPDVQQWGSGLWSRAIGAHMGFVRTTGWNYKLLDPEFYIRTATGVQLPLNPERLTPAATARYVLRGTASIVLFPLPWHARSPAALAYLPEQLAWYVLVGLAVVGVVSGLRLDASLTLVLAGVTAVGVVAIGLASGNMGTMIRHRGILMMLVPWLSSLGACELLQWAARFRVPVERRLSADAHDPGGYAGD